MTTCRYRFTFFALGTSKFELKNTISDTSVTLLKGDSYSIQTYFNDIYQTDMWTFISNCVPSKSVADLWFY